MSQWEFCFTKTSRDVSLNTEAAWSFNLPDSVSLAPIYFESIVEDTDPGDEDEWHDDDCDDDVAPDCESRALRSTRAERVAELRA